MMITLLSVEFGFFDIPLVNVSSREEIEKKKAQAKKSQENQK